MDVSDDFTVEDVDLVAECSDDPLDLLRNSNSINSHLVVLINLVHHIDSGWQEFWSVRYRLPHVPQFDCRGFLRHRI